MKSAFSGFYSTPNESLRDIWLSDSTLFVFDTNCLLNLYRCEDHTREDILKVMKEISSRTWIPFQVGLEYQRKRRVVIEDSIASLKKIKNELQQIHSQNILSSGGVKKHLYNSLNDEISELQNQIKTPIEDYINTKITPRIESKQQISQHDFIRDEIDSIILDNVGSRPTQEKINSINTEGDQRYKNKIPPGFMDIKKSDSYFFSGVEIQAKYGDLYLWKEIIEKSKSDNIHNVIFICDDLKEDWWFIHDGKTHGALAALKTEICQKANVKNFKLISQLTFLHESKENLANIEIRESSLKEVEELSHISVENDEERYTWSNLIHDNYNKNFNDQLSFFKKLTSHRNNKTHQNPSALVLIQLADEALHESENKKHQGSSMLSDFYVFENELLSYIDLDVFSEFTKVLKLKISQMEACSEKLTSLIKQIQHTGFNDVPEIQDTIRELRVFNFLMDSLIEKGNEYLKYIL
ncbi:PIN domain-containing protein [Buttiauxella sp. A111]|uniref:PIN domain-containing protein n=1 Tax=Buttiauxella sp. A111 TaxID=2563088 RepID=UPI0010CF8E45|nr:PIN domain-containing protein [Buttiauxella sp. A111]GDX05716.1 hypothetical protein BSPA111_19170 [Buttiauxella sp. A111]